MNKNKGNDFIQYRVKDTSLHTMIIEYTHTHTHTHKGKKNTNSGLYKSVRR
jgi:hypothetical protein